ncbi:MAG TPA: helix-hairpin-helix domain-containing protein, partial [Mycobacterium sp.]
VDISHVQGTDVVASLVVFEDGLPRKSDYRHYAIREAAGEGRSDDVASIAEVTRRRFLRHVSDTQPEPGTEQRPRRFAYPPNLFVVDGGAPQVNAAAAVLDELGVTDVAVIGLAKRLEEVWVPAEPDPVIFPRNSEGLYLLQRVRDEAHRFAISYHRSKRSKRMTASALDSVRGLGEQRRKALVTHFGSVARLKDATVEEITAVPGIGVATAKAVLAALGGEPPIEPGGEPPIEPGGEPPMESTSAPPSVQSDGPRSENSAGLGDSGAPATVIEDDRRRVSG